MNHTLHIPHADRVLSEALSRGGDYAEIFVENTTMHSLELQDRLVSQTQQSLLHGAGIRVIKGTGAGYAHTMGLGLPALLGAARLPATVPFPGMEMPLLEDGVSFSDI